MQNGKFSELHHTTIQDWCAGFCTLVQNPAPASRQHFDVWNFQPTISAWVKENKQLPIFYQPPGLVKSEQIPILPRHQSRVSDWLTKFRTDSDFGSPPESRQHFDVWHQRSLDLFIHLFPRHLWCDSGKNYIIRTIAAVASSLPPGRTGHAYAMLCVSTRRLLCAVEEAASLPG